MRGRRAFGGLVPYGRVWCPGADEATVLDSDLVKPCPAEVLWLQIRGFLRACAHLQARLERRRIQRR